MHERRLDFPTELQTGPSLADDPPLSHAAIPENTAGPNAPPSILEVPATDAQKSRIVRPLEYMLAWGNVLPALPQLAVSAIQKAGAAAFQSLHDVFDAPGYVQQLRLISMASGEAPVINTDSRFGMWRRLKEWATQNKAEDAAKLEKSSFAWISLPALGALALSATGVAQEVMGHGEESGVSLADVAHVGATGATLALAGGLLVAGARMKRKAKQADNPELSRHVNNFYSHAKLDVMSSGVAVMEAFAHMADRGTLAFNLGVMAIAGYQVWRFWPSRAGKQQKQPSSSHDHHDHEHHHHDHGECDHVHLVPHELTNQVAGALQRSKAIGGMALNKMIESGWLRSAREKKRGWAQARQQRRQAEIDRPWWQWLERQSVEDSTLGAVARRQLQAGEQEYGQWRQVMAQRERRPGRLRRALAASAAMLALTAGLTADTAAEQSTAPSAPSSASAQAFPQQPSDIDGPKKPLPVPFTECVKISKGDSQWTIAERRIEAVTGRQASKAATNVVTVLTANENRHANPNPDVIRTGQCLNTPTTAIITDVQRVLAGPPTGPADAQLRAYLDQLNKQPSLADALRQTGTLQSIKDALQTPITGGSLAP